MDLFLRVGDNLDKVVVTPKEKFFHRKWNHLCWIHNEESDILYSNRKKIYEDNHTEAEKRVPTSVVIGESFLIGGSTKDHQVSLKKPS